MANKQTGRIKAGMGTLIGNAGEYYVMAELLKREVIAGLVPRNTPGFDILAVYHDKNALIRVKTKTEGYDVWQWQAKKDGSILRDLKESGDFTILVNLAMNVQDVRYFVIPTRTLNRWLQDLFTDWVSTPGAKGQQRNPENKKRTLPFRRFDEQLRMYENRWEILWE